MRTSLKGFQLPENELDALQLKRTGQQCFKNCCVCERDLASSDAASTRNGWAETQLSGMCEPCFDRIFAED